MAEQPQPARWTRREFLKSTAVAGGLAVSGSALRETAVGLRCRAGSLHLFTLNSISF